MFCTRSINRALRLPVLSRRVYSLIEEQVTNGVAVRMAVINLMLGGAGYVLDQKCTPA